MGLKDPNKGHRSQQDDPMGFYELHMAGIEMGQKEERHLL